MEKPSILEVGIKNFRAIKEATIKLDGITVVAGENSSGKSTISKLLYYLFRISHTYDYFLKKELEHKISRILNILLRHRYRYSFRYKILDKNIISNVEKHILENQDEYSPSQIHRIVMLLEDEFGLAFDQAPSSIEQVLGKVGEFIEKLHKKHLETMQKRNKQLFYTKIANIYKEKLNDFSVKEYGETIIGSKGNMLGKFETIHQSIYIDSPMALAFPNLLYFEDIEEGILKKGMLKIEPFSHWKVLDFYLKNENDKKLGETIDMRPFFVSDKLLDGEIKLDEHTDELKYHRKDKKTFDLLNCATGVKSIAALQMLYNNGWLNKKTLLILDEPEAHLHPQWVVEYARLVVLFNKLLGVKFFIATHNPDVVSAIQDIADKEDRNENLRFYLAQRQKDFTYTYKDTGTNVEDIFASFNRAIDRINEYGADE